MEIKTLVSGIIVLIVGLVLAVSMLVPVVTEAQVSTVDQTEYNDNYYYRASKISTEEECSLTYTAAEGAGYTLTNNTSGNTQVTPYRLITLLASDEYQIVRNAGSGTNFGINIMSEQSGVLTVTSISLNNGALNIEVGSGVITITFGESKWTYANSTYAYVPDANGDYIMTNNGAVLQPEDELDAYGYYGVTVGSSTVHILLHVQGTYKDYAVDIVGISSGYTATTTNLVSNYSEDELGNVEWASYQFVLTVSNGAGNEVNNNVTFNRLFAPYEVQVKEEALDNSMQSLVGIIPLLVIVGLVLGAVGMFITRREY